MVTAYREEFDGGVFGHFYQSVESVRAAGPFVDFRQSVGVPTPEQVFIIFDQVVQMRSVTSSGPFVNFNQDVQCERSSQELATINQKVTP